LRGGLSMLRKGHVENKYTSTGKPSGYTIELYHKGLDEIRHLSGSDLDILEGKVHNQTNSWDKKWNKKLEKKEKERISLDKQAKEELSLNKTKEAKDNLLSIEKILAHTLDIDDAVDWDTVKNNEVFFSNIKSHEYITYRGKDGYPENINSVNEPVEPKKYNYFKKIPILKVIFGQKSKVLMQQENEWKKATNKWEKDKAKQEELENEQRSWVKEKEKYEDHQEIYNKKIDK